jgi:hypothetical protein
LPTANPFGLDESIFSKFAPPPSDTGAFRSLDWLGAADTGYSPRHVHRRLALSGPAGAASPAG